MYTSSFCVWATRAVYAVGSDKKITPRSSHAAHTSDSGADQMGDKHTVEVPVDPVYADLHDKEVLVVISDSQK